MKILLEEAVNAARVGQVESRPGTIDTSAASAVGGAAPASPAATVTLSLKAQEISRAQAAVNAAPDVRQDVVDALKAKIDAGQYHVSGADIADMMLRRHAADHIV